MRPRVASIPRGFAMLACGLLVGSSCTSVVCTLVDDDEPKGVSDTASTAGDTDAEPPPSCLETAAQVQSECEYPLQFWVSFMGGDRSMVLIDDPGASVGIGPGAWLVQIASAADYVGIHHYSGDSCEIGCGWCAVGQHVCHGGLTAAGQPKCWACVPFDAPNAEDWCLAAISMCSDPEDGADETGTGGAEDDGEDDGGLDSTGAGLAPSEANVAEPSADVTEPYAELAAPYDPSAYDCALWQPADGVRRDERGVLELDAALVEDIAVFQGESLALCDGTRFRRRPDGFFELSKRSDRGLLARMGLGPGDVVLAVNGESMNELEAVMRTMESLFSPGSPTSGFTLLSGRGDHRFVESIRVR